MFLCVGAIISIRISGRLAPPPSPFTLQGLFLQQQLEFCPESKSRYAFVTELGCAWVECFSESKADAGTVLASDSTAMWCQRAEDWAPPFRL